MPHTWLASLCVLLVSGLLWKMQLLTTAVFGLSQALIKVLSHGCSHHRALRAHATPLPVHGPHFLLRNIVKCGICYGKVCVSVTLVDPSLMLQDIEICFAPYDRGTFLASGGQICSYWIQGFTQSDCVTKRHPPLETAKIGPIIHNISERCKIG